MSDQTRYKATVWVGGLDQRVTAETLHDAFLPFGEIVEVSLPKPELRSSPDAHRGFGYVEYAAAGDAREAADNMDGAELHGRALRVNAARPSQRGVPEERLGSRTAVWEQEGYASRYNIDSTGAAAADGERRGGQGEGDDVNNNSNSNNHNDHNDRPPDPMQGLEGLDLAGPQMQ